MTTDATRFSLADFHFGDSEDPMTPSADFVSWRAATRWAAVMYEPALHGAPIPRTILETAGETPQPVINLSSYNYLGLAKHPEVIQAVRDAVTEYGTGACGSPILSGMTVLHRRLEQRLSQFLKRGDTVLFNSGFGGALGAMVAMLRKGDSAIIDEKAHMSVMDGVRLSQARCVTFSHNNPESLDECLTRERGRRRLVAVEGIYSMDGDFARLPELLEVAEHHKVSVFIDEAHSILGCGKNGRGVAEHFGCEHRVGLQYATFSKAFAAVGGFLSGNADTIDYIRCFATPYGFSAALPPAVVAGLLAAMDVATRDNSLRVRLWSNAEYFRSQLHKLGLSTGDSESYVVPIVIGDRRSLLYSICRDMRQKGLFLAPVDYPSVPESQVRFRASITAAHTMDDLDEALNIIEDTIVKALKA